MKVLVCIKEVNYGYVEVEVDETKAGYEDKIYEKAWHEIAEGDNIEWGKTDTDIVNIVNWEKKD